MKLDYSIQSPEERKSLVTQILAQTPSPTPQFLETLADYLIFAMEKEERKQRKIITENRLSTVNKRETSLEGLALKFEAGADGVQTLITNDKNQIFRPKISITQQDLEEIPFLPQIKESIAYWKKVLAHSSGRAAYIAKRAIIDLSKDQYLVKNAYRKPITPTKLTRTPSTPSFNCVEEMRDGEIYFSGISFLDPKVNAAILNNYSKLKEAGDGNFLTDTWFLMESFDDLASRALPPHLEYLVELRIDGKRNPEVRHALQERFGLSYSLEYLSSLWCQKVPRLLAAQATEDFLDTWYLNNEKGQYKRCSRCGQIKLAHPLYFSRNNTSRDHFYSLCKDCRRKKKKGVTKK